MKIETNFRYDTGGAPIIQMHAYEINNTTGLQKSLKVLKKIGECIDICYPKVKSDDKSKTSQPTTKSAQLAQLAQTANGG